MGKYSAGYLNNRMPKIFENLERLVNKSRKGNLDDAIDKFFEKNFPDIRKSQIEIMQEEYESEKILASLGETLDQELYDADSINVFGITTFCEKCSESENEEIRKKARNYSERLVDSYIFQREFNESDLGLEITNTQRGDIHKYLKKKKFKQVCDVCESGLEIAGTINIIRPNIKEFAVYDNFGNKKNIPVTAEQIILSKKATLSRISKLSCGIFEKQMKKISPKWQGGPILDTLRAAVITNSQAKLRDELLESFSLEHGLEVDGDLREGYIYTINPETKEKNKVKDISGASCYMMYDLMKEIIVQVNEDAISGGVEDYFLKICSEDLQDNILRPVLKEPLSRGQKEYYSFLQVPMECKSQESENPLRMELQIKSSEINKKEKSKKSVLNHAVYKSNKDEVKRAIQIEIGSPVYTTVKWFRKIYDMGAENTRKSIENEFKNK